MSGCNSAPPRQKVLCTSGCHEDESQCTYCVDDATGASAHIFEECLAPKESVVFLEFSSVSEVSIDVTVQRTDVTVAIPRQLAARCGLIPSAKRQE